MTCSRWVSLYRFRASAIFSRFFSRYLFLMIATFSGYLARYLAFFLVFRARRRARHSWIFASCSFTSSSSDIFWVAVMMELWASWFFGTANSHSNSRGLRRTNRRSVADSDRATTAVGPMPLFLTGPRVSVDLFAPTVE